HERLATLALFRDCVAGPVGALEELTGKPVQEGVGYTREERDAADQIQARGGHRRILCRLNLCCQVRAPLAEPSRDDGVGCVEGLLVAGHGGDERSEEHTSE